MRSDATNSRCSDVGLSRRQHYGWSVACATPKSTALSGLYKGRRRLCLGTLSASRVSDIVAVGLWQREPTSHL